MTVLRGLWKHDFPMSQLASWRAGGVAEALFIPADLTDVGTFCHEDPRAGNALFVGHGSNLLVRDGGIGGVVVRTAPGLCAMRQEDDLIYVEAGVGCPKLAKFAAAAGFADAAFFAGVPGTIGGALSMNAGCHGSETWQHVKQALVFNDGKRALHDACDFETGYRSVRFKNGDTPFFAAAWLHFVQGNITVARSRVRDLLRRRAQTQPLGEPSCGSVFRNPPDGTAAAALIESCGLKGRAIGGAMVSHKHANFIVNTGGANAADIENLIVLVQSEVAAQTGVMLNTEVRIVGRKKTDD
ncbi:UDP-N-acetylmuramate dehydrogenase [Candidatus Persebacteraceae bacterium Df01]|jgi:UDP-N-acetylmuramate dehydrogenase|uniref:UDP-N-acetylenolpyruvoylglucosamine reductase n=1 Tax=Candidatus Doriopsillibacter californiensis TaxID=2970740 RepID=A0ABT7QKN2_9GAMM|nr:UDP-N-acetylmuramate dehydrogenase [Candidatus Persebacteraceae bacterium Df01]